MEMATSLHADEVKVKLMAAIERAKAGDGPIRTACDRTHPTRAPAEASTRRAEHQDRIQSINTSGRAPAQPTKP
jgi:hypothetical protein